MDIVIAFDATSSMECYQPEVYDSVTDFLLELGDTGANIRVAAIAIGDHPEHGNSYLEQLQPFTRDLVAVAQHIRAVPESTGGRTQEEAYEDALRTLVALLAGWCTETGHIDRRRRTQFAWTVP